MSQEAIRLGELARPAELERAIVDPLLPFGRAAAVAALDDGGREEVTIRRPSALPGVELWTTTSAARHRVIYHWAYGISAAERVGRHVWRYRRQTREYALGATMLLEPGEVQVTVESTGPTDFRTLFVLPEALDRIFGDNVPSRHFPEPQIDDPQLTEAFAHLWRAIEAGQADALALETLLQSTLALAFARTGERPQPLPATGCERAIRRARAYIEERFAEKISLDDLAREAGLSKFHLERSFTSKTGIALYQFVKKVRIARALELLRGGRRPAEVASRCGFSDQPHLTRVFREELGFTPRHYWAAARR